MSTPLPALRAEQCPAPPRPTSIMPGVDWFKQMIVEVSKSSRAGKKYAARVGDKTVHFGAAGKEDYTIHRDAERKRNYISRHRARENWTKGGVKTAGFWAKHLLWNKPSLKQSARDIRAKMKITVVIK